MKQCETMEKVRAVVLGSMNFDCVGYSQRFPQRGETLEGDSFKTYSGGKGANQAVQLALLGAEVSFIGSVGSDPFGATLLQNLRAHGIHSDFVSLKEDVSTGTCLITVDSKGDNTILYFPGANKCLREQDIDLAEDTIRNANVFLTQNEINIEVVAYGLKMARKHNVVTILNPAPAVALPDDVYHFVNYITPNETEAEAYTGIFRADMDLDQWLVRTSGWFLNNGVNNVLITLGEKGAYFNNGSARLFFPAFPVNVVDTTAAGDAFNGGLAYLLANKGRIDEAIAIGCACGALAAQNKGAQSSMGDKMKIRRFIQGRDVSIDLR